MESSLRESLSSLSKAHSDALTQKIAEMIEEINKVKKRKVDLANKIRQFIQQGIQDLVVYQPAAPLKQIKFRTRLSQDLLP